MRRKHYSGSEAQRVIGGGGSFSVCYCSEDGRETSATLRALGVSYVPHQGCFLICRECWLPLSSVRRIQPQNPAPR